MSVRPFVMWPDARLRTPCEPVETVDAAVRARPELWRRFAQGERGGAVAALGGIRDRRALAIAGGRLRGDPVFRDAAHHFLRRFDRMLADLEPAASDAQIAGLTDTRTARAFILLGRVMGIFD